MFERNPVDNASAVTVAVEITLDDGTIVTGRAAIPKARAVHKLMDGADPFLYVEHFDGEAGFLPKSAIRSLKLVATPRPQPLAVRVSDAANFDPFRVLGLDRDASFDDIRAAYHRLSKLYHPDVYAGVALPSEVTSYLDARAKEINAAFRLLKSKQAREPVYSKAGR